MRQTFISMCASMMEDTKLFEEHFLDSFVSMQTDKIINVRMHLSETLLDYFTKQDVSELKASKETDDGSVAPIYNHPKIVTMVKRLQYDVRDISYYLKKIKVHEATLTPE